jgi:DNA-binding XRE family transcriptional regulator
MVITTMVAFLLGVFILKTTRFWSRVLALFPSITYITSLEKDGIYGILRMRIFIRKEQGMPTMTQTKLKALRQELDPPVAQEDFARSAGLRLKTYGNVERGQNTSYTTAQAILKTMNELRATRGLSLLVLEDLGLNIV